MPVQSENSAEKMSPQTRCSLVGQFMGWLPAVIGVSMLITVFLPPARPYILSRQFWYADFRYWSGWISGCCWLVFAWAVVSTLLTLFVPKNAERTFLLRRSFYQRLVLAFSVISIWAVWYNDATLPLAVIFKPVTLPVTNWIDKNYTLPLADYYTTGEGISPLFFPTLGVFIFIAAFILRRVLCYFKRWKKHSKTIIPLFLVACLPTILGAEDTVRPKKVETSTGIYDVQSKDDLLNFTAEDIRKLVKMEDERTKGAGKTPHPVLVYCFEERSFKYTGGKYDNTEIKYRLHVPQKIKSGKKYPLVVHLHGVGEAGKDNMFSLAHLHSILPLMIGPEQQDFFLLVLQCPPDNKIWTFKPEKDGNLDVVAALTDYVIANNPIDKNRLSSFGLSSGGYGVWQWLMKEPDKFAAAVPASCGSPYDFQKLATLKQTPIWTFRNKTDNNAPIESIREAMRVIDGSGGFMELTQIDQGGHAAWRPAMDEYHCFSWMIAQKRGGWFNPPPERKVYTYRSASNCFFAFFFPLLLASGVLLFQRSKYSEHLHENIVRKLYSRRIVDEEDGFYIWTDNTGKRELELKLLEVQGNKAILEARNGKVLTIPISAFCSEDQEYLKQYND